MGKILELVFGKQPITGQHYAWHKVRTPWIAAVRLTDGTLSSSGELGQLWRRRTRDGRWEHKQDSETADQFDLRQY